MFNESNSKAVLFQMYHFSFARDWYGVIKLFSKISRFVLTEKISFPFFTPFSHLKGNKNICLLIRSCSFSVSFLSWVICVSVLQFVIVVLFPDGNWKDPSVSRKFRFGLLDFCSCELSCSALMETEQIPLKVPFVFKFFSWFAAV